MTTTNYIILRSRDVTVPTSENVGTIARATSFNIDPESIELLETELSPNDRRDLRRDPRTRAMAPPMPMKLIEPMDEDEIEASAISEATWGVKAVRATDSPFTGEGITVAVLDTGIDPNHPAFNGMNLVRKNYTSESDDDLNGHGTHCAGTIFGKDVKGKRIGVARGVKRALIGKVLGRGGGTSATIAQAVQWAVSEGAQVISMSLGIDFPGYVEFLVERRGLDINPATSIALEAYRANINLFTELAEFVQAQGAFGNGTVIVAASGNESKRSEYEIAVAPPAAGTGIISVGALGESSSGLKVANFSNNQVDIAGPGVGVVSAFPNNRFRKLSGTSMATPHVAGVAALWAQRQLDRIGRVESRTLIARLIASGIMDPLASNTEEEDVGTGIVQAPLN